jgi:hypothetical protein
MTIPNYKVAPKLKINNNTSGFNLAGGIGMGCNKPAGKKFSVFAC